MSANQITAHNAGWRTQFRFADGVSWSGVCEFWRYTMSTKRLLISTTIAAFPAMAYAQGGENARSTIEGFLWAVVPLLILLIIFLAVLFLIVRWAQSGPRAKRADRYMATHEQHMKRVEESLERISKALEKKDTKIV